MEKVEGKRKKSKPQGKSQNFKFWLVVLPFTFLLLTLSALYVPGGWACPGCKEALFDPAQLPQKLATAKGYALSIGLLLAVPLVLIGGIATLVIRSARRGKILP